MLGEKSGAGFNPSDVAKGDFKDLGHEQRKPREMSRVFIYQFKNTDQI